MVKFLYNSLGNLWGYTTSLFMIFWGLTWLDNICRLNTHSAAGEFLDLFVLFHDSYLFIYLIPVGCPVLPILHQNPGDGIRSWCCCWSFGYAWQWWRPSNILPCIVLLVSALFWNSQLHKVHACAPCWTEMTQGYIVFMIDMISWKKKHKHILVGFKCLLYKMRQVHHSMC